MSTVQPLDSLARRIPIVAKMRSGATTAKGAPKAIDKWRATTSSKIWAENFANRYGGEVVEFKNPRSPHSFEVFSNTDQVNIALIDDGYSINYELWSGGGCQRRCNGVTAEVLQTTGPDNVEYTPTSCICDNKGVLECSLKSRLTFVLPDLPFAGGVVYETSSKNFAEESQGMLQLIQAMQARGITRGVLRLEQRRSSGNRKFTIAVVGVSESLDNLESGTSSRSLGPAEQQRPELSSPMRSEDGESASTRGDADSPTTSGVEEGEASAPEQREPDAGGREGGDRGAAAQPSLGGEDIVDAELVEDEIAPPRSNPDRAKRTSTFMAIVGSVNVGLDYKRHVRPWLAANYGGTWSELDDATQKRLVDKLTAGSRTEKEANQAKFGSLIREWHEGEGAA